MNFSPEYYGDSGYSYKCDVWALGCILYELCSLKHPFKAKNEAATMYKICHKEPEEIPEEYSHKMRSLVTSLLSKDPNKRPKMDEVLREIQKQEGIPPEKWTWIYSQKANDSKWLVSEDPLKYSWSKMEPGCANHIEGYFTTNREVPIDVEMNNIQYRINIQNVENMFGYVVQENGTQSDQVQIKRL